MSQVYAYIRCAGIKLTFLFRATCNHMQPPDRSYTVLFLINTPEGLQVSQQPKAGNKVIPDGQIWHSPDMHSTQINTPGTMKHFLAPSRPHKHNLTYLSAIIAL